MTSDLYSPPPCQVTCGVVVGTTAQCLLNQALQRELYSNIMSLFIAAHLTMQLLKCICVEFDLHKVVITLSYFIKVAYAVGFLVKSASIYML